MSATLVLAHAGHWAVDLAIYLGPLVVIGVMLWLNTRGDADGAGDDHGGDEL